jgi:hypothetical protein
MPVKAIASAVKSSMRIPSFETVKPEVLAIWLGLELMPSSFDRCGLFGLRCRFNDAAPRSLQQYQIGRAACAYALGRMGLIRSISAHDLAVELCGVSPRDRQVEEDAPISVACIARARARRFSGFRPC